jgi:hypothetical protein
VLSHPSSLQGPSDIPPPVTPISPVSSGLIGAYRRRSVGGNGRTSGPVLRPLSPHAMGLTPGSLQVLLPLASLQPLAFPIHVKGRRVSHSTWVHPSTGLSQRCLSGVTSRGCTLRFMLRPADLAGIPGWVRLAPFQHEPSRCPVKASSTDVLARQPASCLHTQKGNWCDDLLSCR